MNTESACIKSRGLMILVGDNDETDCAFDSISRFR
jgi:hypothetical protein